MKKISKSKKSSVPPRNDADVVVLKKNDADVVALKKNDADVVALINQMQQQLVSLEKKIDSLISRPSERPFERPSERERFSKPFKRFDRSPRRDEGRRDDISSERSFTQVICAGCQKECEVPFKPIGDRPVYCKECFSKRKEGGSFKREYDNKPREGGFGGERSFDRPERGGGPRHGRSKPGGFRRHRERS